MRLIATHILAIEMALVAQPAWGRPFDVHVIRGCVPIASHPRMTRPANRTFNHLQAGAASIHEHSKQGGVASGMYISSDGDPTNGLRRRFVVVQLQLESLVFHTR